MKLKDVLVLYGYIYIYNGLIILYMVLLHVSGQSYVYGYIFGYIHIIMACTGFLCKDIPKCDHGAIFSRIKHGTHSSCFSLQLNICTCVFPITKHPILLYIWKPYFLKGFQRCNKHICKSIPGIDDFASYWLVEQQTT